MSRPIANPTTKPPRRQCANLSARPQGGGRPATVTRYRSVVRPGHPLADNDGRVRVHRLVLFEKIGGTATACNWCKRHVAWFGTGDDELVVDHLDEDRWNNAPDNLVPACRVCNMHRKQRAATHCTAGHRLDGVNLYIRPDTGSRQCRACKQEAARRFSARRSQEA